MKFYALILPAVSLSFAFQSLLRPVYSSPAPVQGTVSKKKETVTVRREQHQRKSDDIPNFYEIKQLSSLTPDQLATIKTFIKQSREQFKPLVERLRSIKQEGLNQSQETAKAEDQKMGKSEVREIKRQLHDIRNAAWLKIQKVLTANQKAEVAKIHQEGLLNGGGGARGGRHGHRGAHKDIEGVNRYHAPVQGDAAPSMHDSGGSFSQ